MWPLRETFLRLLTVLLLVAVAGSASAGEHVRVILDISKSMRRNDPARLAPLSTLLLYDLAAPDVTLDDSFVVLPFHLTQKWNDPADPPPVQTATPIAAGRDRRKFVRAVHNLSYDADWTYFYPGLRQAVEDLRTTPGGRRDVRVVVLVTDGVPERDVRDEELRRIHDELQPRMEAAGIRFYVLAFGPQASTERDFFEHLVRGTSDLGELFIDPTGGDLLTHMAEIFSRSFGYTHERVGRVPASALDLDGGVTPRRVAVTVFSRRSRAPKLDLSPPPGGSVNAPGGVITASEAQASYALSWVLSPDPGSYALATDAPRGQVGVLRPTRVELELRPKPPLKRVDRVMAGKPFTLRLLARPATGGGRDTGPLDVAYRIHGERSGGPGGGDYVWDGPPQAPPAGSGATTPEGRTFDLRIEFPIEPHPDEEPTAPYQGHIEVAARRGEAVVASLDGPRAHRVEVHPFLAMHPVPTRGEARNRRRSSGSPSLSRGDEGCSRFRLEVGAGHLPEGSSLGLRAAIDPSVQLKGPFAGALFTLDGLPLDVEGHPGAPPGSWYSGRLLDRDGLLGEHVACVHVGEPSSGDPGAALEVPLLLTLQESPYDAFDVVQPFVLAVRIAKPTLLERWGSAIWLGLLMLGTLVGLLAQRFRPGFPRDLRVVLGRTDSAASPSSQSLARASTPFSWLPGVRGEYALEALADGRRLGSVRPLEGELFALRPARGVRVETPWGDALAPRHGVVEVQVRRPYLLRLDGVSYDFRLEYAR